MLKCCCSLWLCLALVSISTCDAMGREIEVPTYLCARICDDRSFSDRRCQVSIVGFLRRKTRLQQEGQTLITAGPYSFLRYLMYIFFAPFCVIGLPPLSADIWFILGSATRSSSRHSALLC